MKNILFENKRFRVLNKQGRLAIDGSSQNIMRTIVVRIQLNLR